MCIWYIYINRCISIFDKRICYSCSYQRYSIFLLLLYMHLLKYYFIRNEEHEMDRHVFPSTFQPFYLSTFLPFYFLTLFLNHFAILTLQ